jgi:hypothetical protein
VAHNLEFFVLMKLISIKVETVGKVAIPDRNEYGEFLV